MTSENISYVGEAINWKSCLNGKGDSFLIFFHLKQACRGKNFDNMIVFSSLLCARNMGRSYHAY